MSRRVATAERLLGQIQPSLRDAETITAVCRPHDDLPKFKSRYAARKRRYFFPPLFE
ncbi:MAG: hypothetical protein ABIP14_09790 [Blastocatellia bacterium]